MKIFYCIFMYLLLVLLCILQTLQYIMWPSQVKRGSKAGLSWENGEVKEAVFITMAPGSETTFKAVESVGLGDGGISFSQTSSR